MEELARGRGCEAASGGGGGTVGTEEVLAVKEGGHGAQLLGDPLEMLQGGVGRLRGCNEMRGAHRRMVAAPWVGSARATAAGASVCSAPRTSTKIESERFVVRREERVAKSASQLHSASRVQFVTRPGLARFHAV